MKNRHAARFTVATGVFCAVFSQADAYCAQIALYELHIESQSLNGALLEFARQTGLQIMVFSNLADGLQSPALQGHYTIATAMGVMLSQSSLTYRMTNAKTIEIVPGRVPPSTARAEADVWISDSTAPNRGRLPC